MNTRQETILEYLKDSNRWVKSKELSQVLGVTPRTVRNDIFQIKGLYGEEIINSSRAEGYRYNSNIKTAELEQEIIEPSQRLIYVVNRLLCENDGVSIFDLAENLFVSESTVESDLIKLKKMVSQISDNQLELLRYKEYIKLKNLTDYYFEDFFYDLIKTENQNVNFTELEKYFVDINLNELYQLVAQIMNNEFYSLRYISLKKITLSIALIIQRYSQNNNELILTEYNTEETVYDELIDKIQEVYDVNISLYIKKQLAFYSKKVQEIELLERKIKTSNIEEDEIYALYIDIFERIKVEYKMDFTSYKSIIGDIAIHTKIAIERMKAKIKIYNPLKQQIINHYPFLFNIGISISKSIQEKENVNFTDNEIAYLVAYLASAIERLKRDGTDLIKVNVLLVVFEGKANLNYIYDILKSTNNNLNLFGVSYESDLKNYINSQFEFDMIISTQQIKLPEDKLTIISSAFTIVDQIKVKEQLQLNINMIKLERFKRMFNHFFKEELFFGNLKASDKKDVINIMLNKLEDQAYINDSFKQSVFERESLASTSMSTGIALPHPTEIKSLKTGVAIATLKNTVSWSDHKVKIVFLFANTREDISKVYSLYDFIAKISLQQNLIDELKKCKGFKEVEELLTKFYIAQY